MTVNTYIRSSRRHSAAKPSKSGRWQFMLCKLAAGRESTQTKLSDVALYQKLTGKAAGNMAQLHSTLGRISSGRTVHTVELQNILQDQYNALIVNIGKGDYTTFVAEHSGDGRSRRVGTTEAPRGMLSHWMLKTVLSVTIERWCRHGTQVRVTSTMTWGRTNSRWSMHADRRYPAKPLEVVHTIRHSSPTPLHGCAVRT